MNIRTRTLFLLLASAWLTARLITNVSEGKLQIHYQFNVNKITHDSKSYPALRQMFESFAGFVNNKLVVKRAE
ncbi:MAG: hypothetical protein IKH01_03350 [Prevotella sp.]|nr:hypothetical protein [Prevotella sp.]